MRRIGVPVAIALPVFLATASATAKAPPVRSVKLSVSYNLAVAYTNHDA